MQPFLSDWVIFTLFWEKGREIKHPNFVIVGALENN